MPTRRRRGDDLHDLHIKVRAQEKSDLKALAKVRDITMGAMIGRFIRNAVARQARRGDPSKAA